MKRSIYHLLIFSLGLGLSVTTYSQTLRHSYTFTANADDQVGEAHGELRGGVIENGRYVTSLQGNHIALPASVIDLSQYAEVSLEFFIETPAGNGWNTMLAYFGRTTQQGYGADYLYFSPKNGGQARVAVSCLESTSPWAVESSVSSTALEDSQLHHVVVVMNSTELNLYLDGELSGTAALSANNQLSNISSELAYLGKGGYIHDPSWLGAIDEFNIYEGLLSSSTIQAAAIQYFNRPEVIASQYGTVNQASYSITGISPVSAQEFLAGLKLYPNAKAEIVGSDGSVLANVDQVLNSEMTLQIIGSEVQPYSLQVREVSSDNLVKWAFNAELDHENSLIYNLDRGLIANQLTTGVKTAPYATFRVMSRAGEDLHNMDEITGGTHLEVTAENGDKKTYTIYLGDARASDSLIADSRKTYHQLPLGNYKLEANVKWYILSKHNPMPGSRLNLTSEDIWIYFPNIQPQALQDQYLSQISINGEVAVPDENMRLVQHGAGSVVIAHSKTYQPLTVYTGQDLTGDSMKLGLYTYYKINDGFTQEPTVSLGAFEDNIESFVLKKGYMASLSQNSNGTGVSKVYIADEEDVVIRMLPDGLANGVSFIRVFPWRWVNKKGYVGNAWDGQNAGSQWVYCHCDSHGEQSSLNVEYVPLRHNPGWPSYTSIQAKKNITHALFFNEPDNPVDDGYATVQTALDQYPNLLASGLRMVSPAPTDGGADWLFDFVNQCKVRNYRLDAVAIHFYRGCQSPQQFYDFLNYIHTNTGLPVWVTEWNNGCNWSGEGCIPDSYEEQAQVIRQWVDMLESAPFVERYSIWPGCTTYQQFWSSNGITPAGAIYRDKRSGLAYSSETGHDYHFFPADKQEKVTPNLSLSWVPKPASSGQLLYLSTTSPPAYKTQLAGHVGEFALDEIVLDQTYYWRIDEYQSDGTVITGEEMQFTTLSHQKAYNPVPEDKSDIAGREITLRWKSDPKFSKVHELYFGSDPENLIPHAEIESDILEYDMNETGEGLEIGKTYYWRIDQRIQLRDGNEIIHRGDVWSFTPQVPLNVRNQSVSIYPNPVREQLQIKGMKYPAKVDVYNMAGQIVLSESTQGSISVKQLAAGVYVLSVNGVKVSKFIVEE